MALDEKLMRLAIGIGCRRGVASENVIALVRDTMAQADLRGVEAELFSIDAKAQETGLIQAADALAMRLIFLPRDVLARVATPTQSAQSLRIAGVGSVAESAALAGAGEGAVLCVPRTARDGITCAIARARA